VSSLTELAIEVVANNFPMYPDLKSIKQPDIVDRVIEKVSVDLPITITASNIRHESYWKKVCLSKWKNLRPDDHAWSWK
jgi:hypothetical protein